MTKYETWKQADDQINRKMDEDAARKGKMDMIIKTKRTLEILNISADEWDLYTHAYPADCHRAAEEINCAILDAVNRGATRDETETAALRVMHKHADRGAMDSEPLYKLETVLNRIYGD